MVQTEGVTGWEDWCSMELEAEALLEVQTKKWETLSDCAETQ